MTRAAGSDLPDGHLGGVDGMGDVGSRVRSGDRDLDRHQQLLRTEVHRLHVDHALDPLAALDGRPDATLRVGAGGLAEQQALGLQREDDRDDDEQQADQRGADHVEDRLLLVSRVSPTPNSAKVEAGQRGEVLEQDHRQLGRLGAAYVLRPRSCRPRTWLASRIAVRKLKPSSTIATPSTTSGTHHQRPSSSPRSPGCCVHLVPLVVGLVEREQATDAEQHDRRR